jgi:hypothetical protein
VNNLKRTHTAHEIEAAAVARKRGLVMGALALLVGALMAWLTSNFVSLHCAMMLGVTVAGGLAAAKVALPVDGTSVRSAGSIGGIYAGLGFAIPFITLNLYKWATTSAATVGARIADLSPVQIDTITKAGFPLNDVYFRNQDVSYVFGYLLFALFMGWIFGMVGGALAKRRMTRA